MALSVADAAENGGELEITGLDDDSMALGQPETS